MIETITLAIVLAASSLQPTSNAPTAEPANGVRHAEPMRFAMTGATIHARPGEVITGSTLFIEQGRIKTISVEPDAAALATSGWQVVDLSGLHIYPGLIEPFFEVDAGTLAEGRAGRHWSTLVMPERSVIDGPGLDAAARRTLRNNGFVSAALSPRGGIFRGRGAVVSTADAPADTSKDRPTTYAANVFQMVAFETTRGERAYPTSHMGAVALIRQVLLDAEHRHAHSASAPAGFLDSLRPEATPLWFDTNVELEALLAGTISREFGLDVARTVIIGSGTEFRRLDAIAADGHTMIVPLRFPAAPDVSSVSAAEGIDLSDLMHWEQAPTNPRRLADAGVTVALTSSKLPEGQKFRDNVRRAIEAGLSEDRALAMLTTIPAAILGVDDRLGTLEAGKLASLVVTDGRLFDEKTRILSVWVEGHSHHIADRKRDVLDGMWNIRTGDGFEMQMIVKGTTIEMIEGDARNKARKVVIDLPAISFLIDDEDDDQVTYVVSGVLVGDRLAGTGIAPFGQTFQWTAMRTEQAAPVEAGEAGEATPAESDKQATEPSGAPRTRAAKKPEIHRAPDDLGGVPFGPYAMPEAPAQQTIVLHNATIWTQGPDGIIENGHMIVSEGRIVAVGAGGLEAISLPAGTASLDAGGRHITPGLIDAHSHTGLFRLGVNEAGQAVTAECRIGDALDPGNINWYRQLAGGVTTANLLHGSANPIGGQSQIVKVRWGALRPQDMFFEDAKPGIKFALGENVKQSNWGDRFTTRYPQTRMGVETIMRDRFFAAQEYAAAPARYQQQIDRIRMLRIPVEEQDRRIAALPRPRRDLELETLAEILAGERLVHCHSYRQDEILMLCRVAEEFGFTIGTFQHGLEVYKVAEAVRQHAIGASLFSDWWAYKVEVQDAIPYAGPLQTRVGVLTSYNSDSDELARRMNGEAAKAVKYGDGHIAPHDALAFVTINPAIQLGIADRVGSLEAGKDADFVIWSASPLSSFSRCEATWIDGREYYSLERDREHRERIGRERHRLLQLALEAPRPKASDPKATDAQDSDKEQDANEPEPELCAHSEHTHDLGDLIDRARRGILSHNNECGCDLIDHEARLIHLLDQ